MFPYGPCHLEEQNKFGLDRKTTYVQLWVEMMDESGTPVRVEMGPSVVASGKQDWVYESVSNTLTSLLDPAVSELLSNVEDYYQSWCMSDEGKKQQTRLFSTFHTVVHGDFHLGNMLFNPDSERLKIIDNAYWGR